MIALDVDYKGSKNATITVWRPEYITVDGIEELQATAVVDALVYLRVVVFLKIRC